MLGAFLDWVRGGSGGGGFPTCSSLWAWGVVAGGGLLLLAEVWGGSPKVAAVGLLAGGLLSTARRTRTAGATIAAATALFSGVGGGGGGIGAGGLVIAIAGLLGRPDLGMRGLQLTLPAYFLASVVGVMAGDWSYVAGLLVAGAAVPRIRLSLPWILAGGGFAGWLFGLANLDILCAPGMVAAWMSRTERDSLRSSFRRLPARIGAAQAFLWQPVGGWRTRLVVAAMGWAMYQNWLIMAGRSTMWEYATSAGPASVTALYALGVAGIFLGLRPGLALATGAAGLWHLLESWVDAHPQLNFTGEEYLVWFIFPAGLFILSTTSRGVASRVFDNLVGMFCRVLLFGSLGFAVLAKLNTDFFNPDVSCMAFARDIAAWWKVSPGVGAISPGLLVAAEATPLVLSFLSAPLAVLAALGFTQGLVAIGPLGINACIIALSLGLLGDRDMRGIRRHWKVIALCVSLFVLFVLPFSQLLYQGPRHWYQFAVFHTVCVALAAGAAAAAWGRCKVMLSEWKFGGLWRVAEGWREGWKADLEGVRGKSLFFAVAAGLLLFNGLCPYLGIKFRCSFSMLANLRVDHDRWNHFFMPRGMLMTKHDPYVRVISVEDGHFTSPKLAKRKRLEEGFMYSPERFARACATRKADGNRTHLVVRWMGAEGVVDSEDGEAFQAFVGGLPKRRDWGDPGLQEVLSFGNRPQPCVH